MNSQRVSAGRKVSGIAFLTLTGMAVADLLFVATGRAACTSGATCSCVEVQVDTCAFNSGAPAPCTQCRGFIQPCYSSSCIFKSNRCEADPAGVTTCTETLDSLVKGLERDCIGGSIDWFTCYGQPTCVTLQINNVRGYRYTCSTGGGA